MKYIYSISYVSGIVLKLYIDSFHCCGNLSDLLVQCQSHCKELSLRMESNLPCSLKKKKKKATPLYPEIQDCIKVIFESVLYQVFAEPHPFYLEAILVIEISQR